MKQITPINTIGEVSRTIYAHYAQAGWHDFDSTSPVPHTAILEIEMEEPKPIQVAQIYDREQNPINGRVYSEDGIAPTLRTPTGGICPSLLDHKGAEPAIVIGSMQANAMRGSIDGVSPCLTEAMGMGGGQIPMITEPSILGYTRDDKGNVESYHEKDVAGTIHTSSGNGGNTDQFVKEPCGCYDNQFGEFAREPLEGLSRTVKTDGHNAVRLKHRIRKLTPTECFRLMGCEDSDIDKLKSAKLTQHLKSGKVKEKPMPKTQLYKMAGNSIVVDVLYYIFKAMFVDEPPRQKPIQKSLFDI